MPENLRSNEFTPKCTLYSKCLDTCPSSKKILLENDFKLLQTSCLTKEFTKCKIYKEANEKAA
jgi:hypothetical protein